jgi:serine/threonine protein kinase
MGEVYRALDVRLGREVAVKVLRRPEGDCGDALRRFEKEARAAAAIDHPNVLGVHDVGTHEGLPYIVSELLAGETLRERLQDGTALPVRKAVEYAAQIARGLAEAHEKGIVHRDLKPDNVFVTRDGRVKILDFGIARLSSEHGDEQTRTRPGAILGTVGYMSPEQVRGQPVDHRSDLFSLGAILYELVTGTRAFEGDSPLETAYSILNDDPETITGVGVAVPPALESILFRCLEKRPGERYQAALDLAFDLERLSGLPSEGLSRPASFRARLRLPWRAVLAFSLLPALTVGAFWAGRASAPSPAPPPLTDAGPAPSPQTTPVRRQHPSMPPARRRNSLPLRPTVKYSRSCASPAPSSCV